MAHIWILDDSNDWAPTKLDSDAFALQPRLLLRRLVEPPETWALMSDGQPEVRLNGLLLQTGLAVLTDRDEIRLPGFAAWFSTETTAHIEPFPESVRADSVPAASNR